jgi:hypothetical protein
MRRTTSFFSMSTQRHFPWNDCVLITSLLLVTSVFSWVQIIQWCSLNWYWSGLLFLGFVSWHSQWMKVPDKQLGVKASSCYRPGVKSKASTKFFEKVAQHPKGWKSSRWHRALTSLGPTILPWNHIYDWLALSQLLAELSHLSVPLLTELSFPRRSG